MKRRSVHRVLPFRFTAVALALMAAWPSRTEAAVMTWTGGGPTGNWSSALNWTPGPLAPNDEAVFAGTTGLSSVNDLVSLVLNRLTFDAGAGNFTLSGNGLTLADVGGLNPRIVNNALHTTQSIATGPILLDGSAGSALAEIQATAGNLVFSPTATLTTVGTTALSISTGAGRVALINGPINLSGAGATVGGSGVTAWAGANVFNSGQTVRVTGGRLELLSSGSLGSGSGATNATIEVAAGGQIDFNGVMPTVGAGKNFIIAGTGPDGRGALVNDYLMVDGGKAIHSLTLSGNATIGGTKAIDIGHSIAGQVLDGGGNTLTLATRARFNIRAAVSNLPQLVVNSGNVEIEGVNIPDTTAVTLNGNRTTLGAWLGGAGTTRVWAGDMTVNNGASIGGIGTGGAANTLVIGSAGRTLTINGEARLNANTAGFIDWSDISGAGNMRVDSTVAGTGKLVINQWGVGTNGTTVTLAQDNPSFSGLVQISGGTLTLGTGGATGSLGAAPQVDFVNGGGSPLLTINRTGALVFDNGFSGPGSINIDNVGADITFNGPNATGGSGASSFATRVRAGTLTLGSANALSPRATFEVGGLGTATGSLTRLNGFSPTVERFDDAGTTTAGVFNQVVNGTSTPATLTFNINNAGPVFGDFGGRLGGTTPEDDNFGITKLGANDWTLAGSSHTYSGQTIIRGGTLRIGNNATYGIGRLGSATGAADGTMVMPGGSFDFGGQSAGDERFTIAGRGNAITTNGFEVGALRNNPGTAATSANSAKSVTLSGSASIGKSGSGADANNWEIRNTGGTAQLDLGGNTLRKVGNNVVTVADVTGGTGAGNIVVAQGTLALERGTVVDGPGTVTVLSRSFLNLNDNGAPVVLSKAVALNSGGIVNVNGSHLLPGLTTNGYFTAENNSAADTLGLGTVSGPTRGTGAWLGTTGPVTIAGFSAGQRLGPGFVAGASAGVAAPAFWNGTAAAPVALTSNTGAPLAGLAGQDVLANSTVDADRTINAELTIRTLTSQTDVKINDGALLRIADGSVTQRGANHWIQTTAGAMGRLTSGRADGELHLNLPEPLDTASRNDIALRVQLTDNPVTTGAAAGSFVPNLLVKQGTGSATNLGGSLLAAPTTNTFNNHTAGTVINAGRVSPQFGSAIGHGALTVRDGGQLALFNLTGANGAHISNAMSLAGAGVLENAGALGALRLGNGVTLSGRTLLESETRLMAFGGGDVGVMAGVMSGAAGIDKTGDGLAVLLAPNTFTGPTTITRGTLAVTRLGNGGAASGIGASGSAAGSLVFNGGTLRYDGPAMTTDRSFTVDLQGGAISSNYHVGGMTLRPSSVTMAEGGDRTFSLLATNRTMNVFDGVIGDPSAGRTSFTMGGMGTWQILRDQTYSGAVNLTLAGTNQQGGLLMLGDGGTTGNLGNSVQVTFANATDLAVNRSDTLTLAQRFSGVANSEIIQMGSGTLVLSGNEDNTATNVRVENGTVVLAKTGNFNVRAVGGNLFINAGTVRLAGSGEDQLANNSVVFQRAGTFDLNGRQEIIGRLEGTGGRVTNSATGSVAELRLGGATNNVSSAFTGRFLPGIIGSTGVGGYGGIIEDGAGTVRLSKDGNGLIAVWGDNTYTGGTEILQGTLQVGKGGTTGSLGSGPVFLGGGDFGTGGANVGTLRVDRAGTLTMSQVISGPGNVEKRGSGDLVLTAANRWEGITVVRNGSLTADLQNVDNVLPVTAGYALEGGTLRIVGRAGGSAVQSFAPTNIAITNVSGTGAGAGATSFALQGGNIVGDNNGGNLTISLPNSFARAGGGSVDFATAGAGTTTFRTGALNANGIFGTATAAYATWNGTTWATQSGGQLAGLPGSGYNTAAGHVDLLGVGTIAIPGATVAATARLDIPGVSTVDLTGGTTTLAQGGLLVTPAVGAGGVTLQNGTLISGGNEFFLHQHNTAGDLTISAVLGGTNPVITKAGAGRVILASAVSGTGTVHINQGTLQIANGGAMPTGAITNDGSLVIARNDGTFTAPYRIAPGNAIGGSGSLRVEGGSGWVDFNRVNHSYTGTTVISSGYAQSLINGSPQVGTVFLGDAATGSQPVALVSNHTAVTNFNYPIVVPADGGTGPVIIGSSGGSGAAGAIYNGTVELNRPTILAGYHPDRTTFTNSITGNVGTLTIDVFDALGNPLLPGATPAASMVGARRITMEGENSFTGNVEIRNGSTLQLGLGTVGVVRDQIPDTGNVSLFGTNSTLQFNGEGEVINQLNGEVGTVVRSIAGGGGHMVLAVNAGTFDGRFDGGVNGGMFIEKNGSGTLTLGGSEDNPNGRLRVNAGTVNLNKSSSATVRAVGAELVMDGGSVVHIGTGDDQIADNTTVTINGGTMDLNGRSDVIGVLQGLGGRITNSATGTTSTLGIGNTGATASSVYFGSIEDGAGAVRVVKNAALANGLVLAADNNYSGGTDLQAGVLQLGNGGATGSAGTGPITSSANTRLVVDRSTPLVMSNSISGGASLTNQGSGILTLTGANTHTGLNVINDGAVTVVGDGGTSGSIGTGNISNFGELRFNRSDDLTLTQSIADLPADTGAVRQTGSGKTILTGTSLYYGPTTVEAGTLQVDGNLLQTTTTVLPGGTLGGGGMVADVVMAGGTLAPGASAGQLTTGGLTTVSSSSVFAFEIGGLTPGTQHDQLATIGGVSLAGAVLNVSLIDAFVPVAGDKFLLWTNDGSDAFAGTFGGLPEGGTLSVLDTPDPTDFWLISYAENGMVGSSGNDISLTYVPEPSAALSAGAALAALGMRRRRRA